MSIIIKGMNVPNCCDKCFAFTNDYPWDLDHSYFCKIKPVWMQDIKVTETKPNWCPLVELPEHHGDLIDRKDVLDSCEFIGERPTVDNPYSENYACRSEIIENIPAVIEQED